MRLPDINSPDRKFREDTIAYLKSITPRDTPSVKWQRGIGGMFARVRSPVLPSSSRSEHHSWKIIVGGGSGSSAWRTVKVVSGYVGTTVPSGVGTANVLAASKSYIFWLEIELTDNGLIGIQPWTIGDCSIEHADESATPWTDWLVMFDSGDTPHNAGTIPLRIPIAQVTTSDDTDQDLVIEQYLFDDLFPSTRYGMQGYPVLCGRLAEARNPSADLKTWFYDVEMTTNFPTMNLGTGSAEPLSVWGIRSIHNHGPAGQSPYNLLELDGVNAIALVAFVPQPVLLSAEAAETTGTDVLTNPSGNATIRHFA